MVQMTNTVIVEGQSTGDTGRALDCAWGGGGGILEALLEEEVSKMRGVLKDCIGVSLS